MNCTPCSGEGTITYQEDSRLVEQGCPWCSGYGFFLMNEANAAYEVKMTYFNAFQGVEFK